MYSGIFSLPGADPDEPNVCSSFPCGSNFSTWSPWSSETSDIAISIEGDAHWQREQIGTIALAAPLVDELPVRIEDEHPMVARVGHISRPSGPKAIPPPRESVPNSPATGASGTPAFDENAVPIEDLGYCPLRKLKNPDGPIGREGRDRPDRPAEPWGRPWSTSRTARWPPRPGSRPPAPGWLRSMVRVRRWRRRCRLRWKRRRPAGNQGSRSHPAIDRITPVFDAPVSIERNHGVCKSSRIEHIVDHRRGAAHFSRSGMTRRSSHHGYRARRCCHRCCRRTACHCLSPAR